MIAAVIAAVSLVAFLPLYVSYCQAVLASAGKIDISDRVLALAEMNGERVCGGDFERIVQLVRLCPEYHADRAGIQAIVAYHRLLQVLGRTLGGVSPGLAAWAERQQACCSHFAAVALDRSISSSRTLFAQQASHHW